MKFEFKNPEIPFIHTFTYQQNNSHSHTTGIPQQVMGVLLKGRVKLFRSNTSNEGDIKIWVLMDTSRIFAIDRIHKTMFSNNNAGRGYYTKNIQINIAAVGVQSRVPLILEKDSPKTTPYEQTISKSMSTDISLSKDGPAASSSQSESVAETSTDFEVINSSDAHCAEHKYNLKIYKGGIFNGPDSLFEDNIGGLGAHLHELPESALHNYNLSSQALFQANNKINEEVRITIGFRAVWEYTWLENIYSSTAKSFSIKKFSKALNPLDSKFSIEFSQVIESEQIQLPSLNIEYK